MNHSSGDLIERVKQGDESGFQDVIRWYSPEILRLAYLLLGNQEEAQDILQETLLRFLRRVKSGTFHSSNGSLKAFLLTCAKNLCIDHLRKRKNWHFSNEENQWEQISASTRHPDHAASDKQIYAALEGALHRLPEKQRVVFVLFEFNGDSHQEIAQALSLNISQVKSRLHRARRSLRLLLEPYRGEL